MIARRRDGAILRQLKTLYDVGTIGDLTDGQLMERFATDGDEAAEAAFSALVERHEAMVWRVCLAIVGDEHDAEDAFQATFLVLVHKARSLWVRDSLGPWLHQVARRTASCLRRSVIRRNKHERRCAASGVGRCFETGSWRDLDRDAALHDEVDKLPEKYRAPVVLCDLEGRTHQEAARILGWPVGTVKSRQSFGRGVLRDRLTRRGFHLGVAGAPVESIRLTAGATMPAEISRSAVQAAMHHSARLVAGYQISARILTLTQGVLQAMWWTNCGLLLTAILVVGLASGGAGFYVSGSQQAAPAAKPQVAARANAGAASLTQRKPVLKTPDHPPTIPMPAPPPRLNLHRQQLATRKAKIAYEMAKLNRELAEMAVEEFGELSDPRDLADLMADLKLAETQLRRAEDQLEWARRMYNKGYVSKAGKALAESSLIEARLALEQRWKRRNLLVGSDKEKTMKALEAEIDVARAEERAKQAAWDSEKAKEIELERRLGHDSK